VAGWSNVHRAGWREDQLFPELEQTPDLTRGDARLAAEVLLAVLERRAQRIPETAVNRAFRIADVMANG
jgi:hypothetical protein